MTWVIATSSFVSHAVLISDVQVRFQNGKYQDLVQKGYLISNHVAAGFAGSVKIGFSLLSQLSSLLTLSEEQSKSFAWDPLWIARTWPKIARQEFAKHSAVEKNLGAALLIVAIAPTEDRGRPEFPKVYLIRFKSPSFEPGIVSKGFKALSIGSGASEHIFKRSVNDLTRFGSNSIQAETGKKFGWADNLCWSLSRTALENPVAGVSNHFNLLAFDRQEILQTNSDHKTYRGDSEHAIPHTMPTIARSYPEFVKMCQSSGEATDAAIC